MILGCDCTQFVERNACAQIRKVVWWSVWFFWYGFLLGRMCILTFVIMENSSGAETVNEPHEWVNVMHIEDKGYLLR